MTRKHFEALAKALKESNANSQVMNAVANVCADFNPQFNRQRFLKACGAMLLTCTITRQDGKSAGGRKGER